MEHEYPVLDFNHLTPEDMQSLLVEHRLSLTADEALFIQNNILKRPPTLAECHLWSIQGSEHCSYKSSRNDLKHLPTDAPNVILGPKEDAGIVAVATDNQGLRYGVAMSHESHNHPSQIVPFEGAATGIGGNLRDINCMGAEVIALADGLRFGDLSQQKTHWIYEGVVEGIASYGNAVGVPNIAGDVYFDSSYNQNCLVTVMTLGIVREDEVIHSYAPNNADDYVYILVGKATDNSGFGGASFSSANLEDEKHEQNKGAIQEPNAFLKRHLLKANYALFDSLKKENLINQVGFKDLGAGGVACASVEIAEAAGYGAEIEVEKIPTSMDGLPPHVLLCSETQERFMWVVPPQLVDRIIEHYNVTFALPEISYGACAAVVGKIRTDGQYIVKHFGNKLIDAKASDITKGIVYDRPKTPIAVVDEAVEISCDNLEQTLLDMLSHENIASKEPLFETYDKQVQGRTIIEAGMSDSGVLMPFAEDKYPQEIQQTGIALSLDHNPRYNMISPYWGAVNAVVEAARNVAATGASPQAVTDCLCFGNPEYPERMWSFSEAIRGIKDACYAIGLKEYPDAPLPVIAGNVSFYNETDKGAIPPSPMISCLGAMPDAFRAVDSNFKQADSQIIMIGARLNECGGSVFYQLFNKLGTALPKPDLHKVQREIHAVIDLIQKGFVLSAHDISDGGVAVALAEMSFKHQIGFDVMIPGDFPDEVKLFSEAGGFVLEVPMIHEKAVNALLKQSGVHHWLIGQTTSKPYISIQNKINLPIDVACSRWTNGLREKLL